MTAPPRTCHQRDFGVTQVPAWPTQLTGPRGQKVPRRDPGRTTRRESGRASPSVIAVPPPLVERARSQFLSKGHISHVPGRGKSGQRSLPAVLTGPFLLCNIVSVFKTKVRNPHRPDSAAQTPGFESHTHTHTNA